LRNGKSGEAYNVGSPSNKINILDLARRVIKLLGSRSKVSFVDPKFIYGDFFAEANDKYPSIEKAETELGWKGKIDIDRVIWDAYLEFKRQKEAGILKFEIT
jgi:nucleoside-diphosphate-sugar epimerase